MNCSFSICTDTFDGRFVCLVVCFSFLQFVVVLVVVFVLFCWIRLYQFFFLWERNKTKVSLLLIALFFF